MLRPLLPPGFAPGPYRFPIRFSRPKRGRPRTPPAAWYAMDLTWPMGQPAHH